ncbi:MAG: TolB-like 6-bladed beta-propeller domain-containing protein [Mediterranea sp.]|nr:TolB-like 6-bladed beta-propeller domain-containing protein [Mediterranea sp.]
MKNKILIIILSTICACSCQNRHKGSDMQFAVTENLTAAEEIDLEQWGILLPSHLVVTADRIVVVECDNDNHVSVFDKEFRLLFRKGMTGQGPQEFIQIFSVGMLNDDEIGLYDANLGVMRRMNIKDSTRLMTDCLRNARFRHQVLPVAEGRFLAVNTHADHAFEMMDTEGCILDSLAYWPPKPEGVSDFTHRLACTGPMALSPDKERFVKATWADGAIEFFRIEGDRLSHQKRTGFFDMDYGVEHAEVDLPQSNERTRKGYTNVTYSRNAVWATFSGNSINEKTPSYELHQYTWDGKPVKRFLLDKPLGKICYDEATHALYCLGNLSAGESVVRIYRMQEE